MFLFLSFWPSSNTIQFFGPCVTPLSVTFSHSWLVCKQHPGIYNMAAPIRNACFIAFSSLVYVQVTQECVSGSMYTFVYWIHIDVNLCPYRWRDVVAWIPLQSGMVFVYHWEGRTLISYDEKLTQKKTVWYFNFSYWFTTLIEYRKPNLFVHKNWLVKFPHYIINWITKKNIRWNV